MRNSNAARTNNGNENDREDGSAGAAMQEQEWQYGSSTGDGEASSRCRSGVAWIQGSRAGEGVLGLRAGEAEVPRERMKRT